MLNSPFLMRLSWISWSLRPLRMAMHSSSWKIAARCAFFPRHSTCLPPWGREQRPRRPKHFLLSWLRRRGALDMNPVGFFSGSPESVCCPSWHWSALILSTQFCRSRFVISGSFHDVASLGCSWRKYAPRSICR